MIQAQCPQELPAPTQNPQRQEGRTCPIQRGARRKIPGHLAPQRPHDDKLSARRPQIERGLFRFGPIGSLGTLAANRQADLLLQESAPVFVQSVLLEPAAAAAVVSAAPLPSSAHR